MKSSPRVRSLVFAAVSAIACCAFASLSHAAIMNGFEPNPNYANLQMWLDASTLPTNSTSIGVWDDRSNKNNDVSQGTGSQQPTYVASDPLLFNQPSVSFDGGDVLNGPLGSTMGITGTNARTMFFVFHRNNAGNKNIAGYGTESPNTMFDVILFNQKFAGHFYATDSIGATTQTYPLNELVVGVIGFDGTTVTGYQHDSGFNGQTASTPMPLNTGDGTFFVGGGKFASYNQYDGTLAEMLVYNEALSPSDIAAIDDYLFTKYTVGTPIVPEPSTAVLLSGMAGLAIIVRRRNRKAAMMAASVEASPADGAPTNRARRSA